MLSQLPTLALTPLSVALAGIERDPEVDRTAGDEAFVLLEDPAEHVSGREIRPCRQRQALGRRRWCRGGGLRRRRGGGRRLPTIRNGPRRSTSGAPPATQPPTPVPFRWSAPAPSQQSKSSQSGPARSHSTQGFAYGSSDAFEPAPGSWRIGSGAKCPLEAPEIHVRPRRSEVSHRRGAPCYPRPAGQDARQTVFLPATGLLRSGPSNARGEAPAFLLETSRTANSRNTFTPRFHRVELDRSPDCSDGHRDQAAPPWRRRPPGRDGEQVVRLQLRSVAGRSAGLAIAGSIGTLCPSIPPGDSTTSG